MIRNFRFGVELISKRKMDFFIRFIQIVISFILLCFIFQTYYDFKELHNKIDNVLEKSEIYVLRDMNTNDWYERLINDSRNTLNFQKLIDTINSTEAEKIILNSNYSTTLEGNDIELLCTTDNFFSKFNLSGNYETKEIKKCFKINFFLNEEWNSILQPAVLGYNFSKKYKKGDIIEDDYGIKYQIIGFLEKNSSYISPMRTKDLIYLDNTFVIPVNIDESDNGSMMEYIFSCQFITEEIEKLEKVQEENRKYKLLDTYFESYTEQLKVVKNDTIECMVLFGTYGGIIMMFSIIGIVCMMIQSILDYEFEYAINMLCGANFWDIYLRVMFQVIFLILSGSIVTFFIYGISKGFFCILIISSACIGFLGIFCYIRLKSETIITKIRIKG